VIEYRGSDRAVHVAPGCLERGEPSGKQHQPGSVVNVGSSASASASQRAPELPDPAGMSDGVVGTCCTVASPGSVLSGPVGRKSLSGSCWDGEDAG